MSLNKWIGCGRLGKDPELRYTTGGTPVCGFSMACSQKFKKDGEWKEETYWANIVIWGKMGETAAQYLTKGSEVIIEGRLTERKWESDGQQRSKVEIVASGMHFVGGKKDGQRTSGGREEGPAPEETTDLEPF